MGPMWPDSCPLDLVIHLVLPCHLLPQLTTALWLFWGPFSALFAQVHEHMFTFTVHGTCSDLNTV